MSPKRKMKHARSIRPEPTELQERIIRVVEGLAVGEVVSFGDVAARAGRPGAARAAGRVLAGSGDTVPWWRVVYSDGHLPPCNPGLQEQRLRDEGVELRSYRVIRSPAGRFSV